MSVERGSPSRDRRAPSRSGSRQRRWLLLVILLGIFIGASGYTFYYAQGASYLSKDPRACVNCHVMREQYDSWSKSSHHAVATCVDCHIPHEFVPKYLVKLENGYAHSTAFTFQNFDEPIRIRDRNSRVLEENCVACHQTTVGSLLRQRAHDRQSPTKSCVRCHISVGHAASR
jgi:cytochrome c nitrite reductase small subunit